MKKDKEYYKKQLKDREKKLKLLKDLSWTMSYNWDLKKILNSVIALISEYTQSDSCFIYLLNNKNNLILEASQTPHKSELGAIQMKIDEGITGWVATHKESVVISQKAYEDKRFKAFDVLPEDTFEAFLSLPIVLKDKVVGVMNIQHKKKKKYKQDMVAFLETIAYLVAGAVESARLISETNMLKQALKTRKIVERAKAVLMRKHGFTESEAHRFLNKKSMDKRKSLKDVAEAILLSQDML